MNTTKNNKLIRQKALARLSGNFMPLINVLLFSGFLTFVIKNSVLLFLNTDTLLNQIIWYILSFLFSSISGMLAFGNAFIYLKLNCSEPFELSDLFYGFKEDVTSCFFISMIVTALNLLTSIPLYFYTPTATLSDMSLYFKESELFFLLMIACYLLYFLSTIFISQAYYLKLDYPELSAIKLIQKSIKIMKGNWLRYVTLHLSFLPLILLVIGSFGLAYLWVGPYIKTVRTLFYFDVVQSN